MPRRARAIRREISPDAKYHHETVARLINKVMMGGKKSTAERIIYGALQIMEQQVSKAPVTVLEQAVRNATPLLEVKPRRVGGATTQPELGQANPWRRSWLLNLVMRPRGRG